MSKYILKNCILYDGKKNSEFIKNSTIIVEDSYIKEVYKGEDYNLREVGDQYEVIDMQGKYVMPGMINLHAHLFANGQPSRATGDFTNNSKTQEKMLIYYKSKEGSEKICNAMLTNVQAALYSGVTTVRSVGDFFYYDVMVRDQINRGEVEGPRLKVSGPIVTVPGGHGAGTVGIVGHTKEELKVLVKQNYDNHVDLIKICVTGGVADAKKAGEPGELKMTLEQTQAVCDAAHEMGLQVASHCESKEGIRIALKAGVDTIEHGSFMDDEIIDLFHKNGSSLTCTLSPALPLAHYSSDVTMLNELSQVNAKVVLEGMIKGLNTAKKNNIPIGLGTDAGCPFAYHHAFWRELIYYKKYVGGSNLEILHKATLENAQMIRIDDETGSIEPGKAADIIVLSNNPAEDLSALRNIDMVMARGNLIRNPKVNRDEKVEDEMLLL